MSEAITKIKESIDTIILEPGKFKVILLNDDKTPVEFVIDLLMKIFHHPQPLAVDLTMKIHNEGSAVAGIYSYEVAEQKGIDTTNLARNNGYPLVVKIEAE